MRASTLQIIIFALLAYAGSVGAVDLTAHEKTCAEIGFKKRTLAFGECVMELDQRASVERTQAMKLSQQQVQQQGDGTNEHQICEKFGFVVGNAPYSDCRLKINIAKQEQTQRQATYDAEQRRYLVEQQRYDAQVAELERQKEKQRADGLIRFGLALMGGTSPHASENFANAGRQALGLAPAPPIRPQIQNFTITNPGRQTTNCTMIGNNINCH
jgi:hypothetical protein